jgi:sulfite reductase (ferredoxin)
MIRIKLPFGKVTSEQLVRITKVSDVLGRLHITTRQDIQIHVSLDRTPQLWAELEKTMLPKRSLWKHSSKYYRKRNSRN